jgi:IclR family acetate operon transcriptional repressor
VALNGTSSEPRPVGGGRDEGNVRSIQRSIRILTTLAEHPYPLGLLELSAYVDLSRASVHRILMTLVRVGWVEQNPRTTKYRLGMGAVGVGIVGMVTNPLIRDSFPYLTRLSAWSGHDSVLSTLVGGKTVQLRRAAGINTELIDFEAGHPQPAYAMADGKLLLSYLDESEAESLLQAEGMRPFTSSTITDVATMMRELETIRQQGFAVDNFERFEAGRGLAVPIMGEGDLPVASMLALGPLDPARDEATIQQMQSLARGLSDRLQSAGELPTAAYEAYYAAPRRPPSS